ncbi:hypothetical protein ACIQXV_24350 [Neobacillus sp. NPDC097160]|uniref:hypothetical protein n=1 Tax=Neobacillus sp. NPDC097160 TaxID=3364298 RepID=UPI00380D15EB
MWFIITSIAVGILTVLLELPKLIKQRQIKEAIMFSFLIVFSITLYVLQKMIIPIPNLLKLIQEFYERIGLTLK